MPQPPDPVLSSDTVYVSLPIPSDLAVRLSRTAARHGLTVAEFMADVAETVVRVDLGLPPFESQRHNLH